MEACPRESRSSLSPARYPPPRPAVARPEAGFR
jgi:hypothetical protein